MLVMAILFGLYPFLLKLYADGGYQGPQFKAALLDVMRHVDVEIVKRSDAVKGFAVLPKRWIVERTISWLRLAKDWECLNRSALAFLPWPQFGSCCESSATPQNDLGPTLRPVNG